MISDARDRRRQIKELANAEALYERRSDYEGAWAGLDHAVKIAESGGLLAKLTGQLSTEARDLRVAQENLAMAWLEHISVRANQDFSVVVDRLSPILTRGATETAGPRKADLLAHLGWASYLQLRDGKPGADPEQHYREALAVDASNPYAHAYLGHWLLGEGGALDLGKAEFQAALSAGRAKDYVRVLQLGAMRDRHDEGDPERVAIINDMRKNNEAIDADVRAELYGIYSLACGDFENPKAMRALIVAVPLAEQAATVRALLVEAPVDPGIDPRRRAKSEWFLAQLFELAGERDSAIAAWRAMRKDVPPGDPDELAKRADVAIRRREPKHGH
jgi:hypothetical protein